MKKWKFVLFTGEILENVYKPIRKKQIKNFEVCNVACIYPARVKNSLRFALSLTVSEIPIYAQMHLGI